MRKYQLVFTAVVEAFAKPFLSLMEKNKIKKKTATSFHQNMLDCVKKIMENKTKFATLRKKSFV